MKRTELAYMASALAMMSQGLEPPAYHREKPKPRKCDQKKCKSCKHFRKKESCSYCEIITTAHRHYVNPMDCACGHMGDVPKKIQLIINVELKTDCLWEKYKVTHFKKH